MERVSICQAPKAKHAGELRETLYGNDTVDSATVKHCLKHATLTQIDEALTGPAFDIP